MPNDNKLLFCVAMLVALSLSACGKSEPPPPKKTKFFYPMQVKVIEPVGNGHGIFQTLTTEFRQTSSLADTYPQDWEAMVKLVAVSKFVNNKNCDSLDFLSPMPLVNHTAFRVGCIGQDGHYRTYVMSRHVDSKGNFAMSYTK